MLTFLLLLAAAGSAGLMFDVFDTSDDTPPTTPDDDDMLVGTDGDDLLINGEIFTEGDYVRIGPGGDSALSASVRNGTDVFGEGGNDTILAVDGDGFGGEGDDSLSNWDQRLAAPFPDTFTDLDGAEMSPRGFGPSSLLSDGSYTPNNLHGGDGNDIITAARGNAFGDAGNDTIFGYGVDLIQESQDDYTRTEANFTLSGGEGDDNITGYANTIFGDAGNDVLNGTHSNLYGGDGNDTLHANSIDFDEEDRSVYDGGAGDDVITSAGGGDNASGFAHQTFIGGAGNDFIDARTSVYKTEISGGEGQDTILAEAGDSALSDSTPNSDFTEILDFDSAEDLLVIDAGTGNLSFDLVEITVDDQPATEITITDADDPTNTSYVLLRGVTPDQVDPGRILIRGVSDPSLIPVSDVAYAAPETGSFPNLLPPTV